MIYLSQTKFYEHETITTLFISILSIVHLLRKQPTPAPSQDCFRDWFSLFNEREQTGSRWVHDVIITLRHGSYSECFMGRIAVSGGKLTGKLEVQKVDGSYQEFDKKVSFISECRRNFKRRNAGSIQRYECFGFINGWRIDSTILLQITGR